MTVQCKKCGADINRKPSLLKKCKYNYCSETCRQQGRRISEYVIKSYAKYRAEGYTVTAAAHKVGIGKNAGINIDAGRYGQKYIWKKQGKKGFFNVHEMEWI